MQIEVVRHGGLAGLTLRGTADTAELAADATRAAEAALRGLRFGQAPAASRHPDSFQYEITLLDGGGRRTAVLDEAELPDSLRPLVAAAIARGHPA